MAMALMPPSARTISTVASSMKLMQSHRMLPRSVRSSRARWAMAKPGVVPMPVRPGSCRRNALKWVRRRLASVVQDWPSGFTYCRSSWQMVQPEGGAALSGYCVPQVVQMKAGMGGSSPIRPGRATSGLHAGQDAGTGGAMPMGAGCRAGSPYNGTGRS